MNDPATARPRTPWHLWLVGALGLLWNAFGAFDYFMSKTRGDAYLQSAGMTPTQIDHFNAMPGWMTAVWAIGVWGALAGTLLLLARRRLAAPVFVASLLAFALSLVYAHLIDPAPDATAQMAVMQGVIFAGCLFFAVYARRQAKAGVLL
jgi:4-hydroxybenzoate polyprenyltransferase